MEARESHRTPAAPAAPATPTGGPTWPPATGDGGPPSRPASLDPAALGFVPQRATRWLSPGVLAASAMHEGVTSVFGSFLDKRELQVAKPCEPDERYAAWDEVWLDYVADTGDGFDATATVAHRVAARELHVPGLDRPLPRGDILVLGGDQVYPSASAENYRNRFEGPWEAALPWTDPGPVEPAHPTAYAIPGNHDWYDGLTGFLRQFGQGRWLGGWRTHQTRSYFAVRLPHRWWLWGIDIQPDALIDDPQLRFFAGVARTASPGDRLVLATAVPAWTRLRHDPQAYRNLAYLERTVLRPAGIRLALTVAGDSHHYARYECGGGDGGGTGDASGRGTGRTPGGAPGSEAVPSHRVTAGGGGAFLHPTHDLPSHADLPITPGDARDVEHCALAARYPSSRRSRALSLAAVLLPWRNPSFMVVPGLVTVALLWTIQFGLRSLEPGEESFAEAGAGWGWMDLAQGMFRNSGSAVLLLALFFGLWAFARTPPWAGGGGRRAAKTVMAAVHFAAQVATVATVCLVAVTVADAFGGWWFTVTASLLAFALGGVACSLTMGAYLAAAIGLPGVHAHANEAFAAARLTACRNFLRLHIDRRGALTVYAVGIDRVVRRHRWRAAPEAAAPAEPWIAPTRGEPPLRLLETVEISPVGAGPTARPAPAPPYGPRSG